MMAPASRSGDGAVPRRARKRVKASRKAIVVLGMHRSGTSALSGLIQRLGADGPATPLGPNAHNPKGHFESRALYRLQDELLESAGSRWDDFRPLPETWLASPKADEFRARLVEMVESEYGRSGFFVVKDPRNCRLVSLWREVLAELRIEPLFVHIHRNPLEVARSLQKRNELDFEYGSLVWLRHLLDAEIGSRGQTRSFTSYDRLLRDWPAEIERIGEKLNITWPMFTPSQAGALDAMVLPELKHNSDSVLLNPRLCAPWIVAAHDIFERWSDTGEDAADHPALDDIRHAFDAGTSVFDGTVHGKGKSLTADLDRVREEIAAAEGRAGAQTATIEALTDAQDRADEKVAAADARHLEQQEAMERLRAERDTLADELTLNRSMLAQRSAEIDDALSDLQAARDTLAARDAESDGAVAQASERIRDLEAAIERRDNDLGRMQVLMLAAKVDPESRDAARKNGPPDAPVRVRRPGSRNAGSSPFGSNDALANGLEGSASDRNMVNDLIRQRNEARAACEHAEFRNQAFLNSSSWRLTAPIRWLALRLKR